MTWLTAKSQTAFTWPRATLPVITAKYTDTTFPPVMQPTVQPRSKSFATMFAPYLTPDKGSVISGPRTVNKKTAAYQRPRADDKKKDANSEPLAKPIFRLFTIPTCA